MSANFAVSLAAPSPILNVNVSPLTPFAVTVNLPSAEVFAEPTSAPSTRAETVVPVATGTPLLVAFPITIAGGTSWANAITGIVQSIAITANRARILNFFIYYLLNLEAWMCRQKSFRSPSAHSCPSLNMKPSSNLRISYARCRLM